MIIHTSGDNTTYGHCPVSHESGQTSSRGALHLEVRNLSPVVIENLYFPVQFRIGQGQSELAPLRPVEAIGRNSRSPDNIITGDLLDQRWICRYDIRPYAAKPPIKLFY